MASITVTADDQQGICRYSSFLMDQAHLTNEITIAKREIEAMEDGLKDLELVLDEDELIRYQFGSGLASMSFEEAKGRLEKELETKKNHLARLHDDKAALDTQMSGLKRTLSGKFGDAIRLD